MLLATQVFERFRKAAGTGFWITKEITSSDITVAKKALTSVATGDLVVEKVILTTDATGLAGATNFEIGVTGETYGIDLPVVETVANLGASAHRSAPTGSIAADTTNDNGCTVTAAVPFVLQAGDNLTFSGSVAAGTGAGKILVAVYFTRVKDGASLKAA